MPLRGLTGTIYASKEDSNPSYVESYKKGGRNLYIDTGIILKPTYKIFVDCEKTFLSDDGFSCGAEQDWQNNAFTLWWGGNCWFMFGNDNYVYDQHVIGRRTILFGNGEIHVDGNLVHTYALPTFDTTPTLYIFGWHRQNTSPIPEPGASEARLYAFKVYDENDNVIFDATPAVKDGEGALFDSVSGNYFKSSGSKPLNYDGMPEVPKPPQGANSVYRYDIDWYAYEPVNSGEVCGTYDGDTSSEVTITLSEEYGGGTVHMYFNADWGYWDVYFDGDGYAYEWGYGVFYLYDYNTGQELYFGFGE